MAESRTDLQERIAELDERLDALSAEVQKPRKRGFLDVLSSLSGLVSGVLIAAVGTAATIMYNNRQIQISHWEALDKYRPYVMLDDPAERVFGYRVYVDLGEEKLVLDLITTRNDDVAINLVTDLASKEAQEATEVAEAPVRIAQLAADEIMAKAGPVEQQRLIGPPPARATETGAEKWAYLGHYVARDQRWKTRYFDFGDDVPPGKLESEPSLAVREQTGALNVRSGMPTPTGRFGEVIDVLEPGSTAKIHEIRDWRSTGYMWARITYDTQ